MRPAILEQDLIIFLLMLAIMVLGILVMLYISPYLRRRVDDRPEDLINDEEQGDG